MKITIECNEKQIHTIQNALDFYSRILIGQWREIEYLFTFYVVNHVSNDNRDKLNKLLTEARNIIYPELRGYDSWGIFNEKNPEQSKLSWDIYQVIRNKLAWHYHPEGGWGCSFDEPMPATKEPLIRMEISE